MAVYDIYGNVLSSVYGIDGNRLPEAYNLNGDEIYSDGDSETVDYSNYAFTQPWYKNIGNTQGFAIYDDKVFWVSKSGNASIPANCYVFNLADGSQALQTQPITIQSGHGNSISIDYPLLYAATAYAPPLVYVNRFGTDYSAILEKTLIINDGSTSNDVCVDENDDSIIWTHGHYDDTNNLISKWDISNLTDNGDGAYTPTLLKTVRTLNVEHVLENAAPYRQGLTFHDGILWFANGYSGSTKSYVVGVNPNTGEIVHVIDLETTSEPEGVQFYPDPEAVGGYAMYVGFQGMVLRKYIFGAK